MAIWDLDFFPPSGHRYSPSDYIKSLKKHNEVAIIKRRITTLRELPMAGWTQGWVKQIGEVYQLDADNHRIYFCILEKTMVVCHACRKKSMKAKPKDLARAHENLRKYLEERQK